MKKFLSCLLALCIIFSVTVTPAYAGTKKIPGKYRFQELSVAYEDLEISKKSSTYSITVDYWTRSVELYAVPADKRAIMDYRPLYGPESDMNTIFRDFDDEEVLENGCTSGRTFVYVAPGTEVDFEVRVMIPNEGQQTYLIKIKREWPEEFTVNKKDVFAKAPAEVKVLAADFMQAADNYWYYKMEKSKLTSLYPEDDGNTLLWMLATSYSDIGQALDANIYMPFGFGNGLKCVELNPYYNGYAMLSEKQLAYIAERYFGDNAQEAVEAFSAGVIGHGTIYGNSDKNHVFSLIEKELLGEYFYFLPDDFSNATRDDYRSTITKAWLEDDSWFVDFNVSKTPRDERDTEVFVGNVILKISKTSTGSWAYDGFVLNK